jgi:alkylated DNA repair dioxygenase AlkB
MYQPKLSDAPEVDFSPRVLVERDGLVTYDPYFLAPETADRAFHSILSGTAWAQEFLKMYGRRIPFPRLTAWYGDPGAAYTYSGIRNEPHSWTPELRELRDRIAKRIGVRFNSVLLNQYRNGQDGLSWHADDEPELGDEPIIASVSLGAVREFQLKHQGDGEVLSIPLEHGSLLVMSGKTQRYWRHRVPKERDIQSARINLTFRVIDAAKYTRKTVPTRRK